ncbi:immunodominant staphylococcal antigen IsaB family protein [Staphylococcus succinus]|uniref:immunodominant staphylococcal antigen IsaB family protein n=1 Tax=Staphylococcus succinus TaxID=61015 RepID=UPI000E67BE57|nr:hypothetical protein [Staphylococcus succinus]RIN41566.1 hypothetical protein BU059_09695 [Staphylococcus succinus]
MNNKLLVFSSSVLATGLLLGASNGLGGSNTAHANTTNNNMNQEDMPMNHNMDDTNGNMNQEDMPMNHNMDDMNGNMNQEDMPMNHNMDDMNGNMNQEDMPMNHNMDDMNGNMNQEDMSMNHNMDNAAQKTMMPYYNYTGYTTYDGHFTQNYDFVRALKHDNVMIDGYKVNTAANDKDIATSKKVNDTMIDMNKDGQVVHITFDTKENTISKDMFKKEHMSNHMADEGQTNDGSYLTYTTNNGMYKAFFDNQGYLMKVMIS